MMPTESGKRSIVAKIEVWVKDPRLNTTTICQALMDSNKYVTVKVTEDKGYDAGYEAGREKGYKEGKGDAYKDIEERLNEN